MVSPGRFSLTPRAKGPEFLAWWAPLNGRFRLSVYDRSWVQVNTVYPEVAFTGPVPGDEWLDQLGFVPAEGSEWAWNEEHAGWERAVEPGPEAPVPR